MILWLAILALCSLAAAADTRVELDVIYHQTCTFSRRNDVSFKANPKNPLRKLKQGCYYIKGKLLVAKRIHKNLQAFIEIKYNRNSETRVDCDGHDEERAFGYGSCMYPNVCDKYGEVKQRLQLRIRASKKSPSDLDDCSVDLLPGNYTGYLKFCLPSKEEFLRQEGLTEEDLPEESEITAYINLYLYKPVNWIELPPYGFKRVSMGHLWKLQGKQEEKYRRDAGIGPEDPIALSELEDPDKGFFFDSNKKAQAIGCHEIVGNVKLPDEDE